MQNVCQPLYNEARNISGRPTAAVIGKRFVAISGNGSGGAPSIAHAAAGARVFGVAGYDAAIGELVPVIRKGVVPVTAAAAISANNEVEVGANGQVIPKAAGIAVGVALFDAANGADALIALYE